jgi:heterodisulfide reductase subunit C2
MAVNNKVNNNSPTPVTCRMVEKLSGEKISTCYQCEKCSNGCPMAFAMDIAPHQVLHSLQLGLSDEVINSDTIWVCASCETCSTRCPNNIDIAHIMDTLRQLSMCKGVKASQKQAPIFHKAFLSNVKALGRMHELSMAVDFSLRAGGLKGLLKQSGFGLNMLRKGKMKLIPSRFRAGQEVKDIFRETQEKQE